MSIARTVAVGMAGLGLGVALGMVLGGALDASRATDNAIEQVVVPLADTPPAGDPPPRRSSAAVRKPRERAGPSAEVATLLERAAAGIAPPVIPAGDGRIEGTVKTRTGEALAGVEITVVMQAEPVSGARPRSEWTGSTSTTASGSPASTGSA